MLRENLQNGFTLVEMAIVMVIIGFITAGILVAADMNRAVKITSITRDVQEFKSSVAEFEDKYGELPGDIIDADDYFQYTDSDGYTCTGGACNGDGSDSIDTLDEQFRAWQHLSRGKMLNANYSGVGPNYTPRVNIPQSEIDIEAGFSFRNISVGGRTADTSFLLAMINPTPTTHDIGVLTPQEGLLLDEKSDDGDAENGLIMATDDAAAGNNCINANDYDATIGGDDRICLMYFWLTTE